MDKSKMSRRDAERYLSVCTLAEVPAFLSHPSRGVRKRAFHHLMNASQLGRLASAGSLSRGEYQGLGRLLCRPEGKDLAQAAGVKAGRQRYALSVAGTTLIKAAK